MLRNIQGANKTVQHVLRDRLTARKDFELFVRLRNAVTAHDRLNWFGHDFPGIVDISCNCFWISLQFSKSFEH